ncbi:MAG: hypothetical protein ACOX5G_04495 [Kiritimatiellia bacterium]
MELHDILEALMLLCFGASWPFSIAKSIRTKVVKGKSPVFLFLILSGYVFGMAKVVTQHAAKRAVSGEATPFPWIFWFYAGLFLLVAVDACLYLRYRKNA